MLFGKEDRNLTMFSKMLRLSGLWFYYDVPKSTKFLSKISTHTFQLINVMVQISAFRVGFRKMYIESPIGVYSAGVMIQHLQLLMFLKNIPLLNQFVYGMRGILKKRGQDWEMKIFDQYCSKSWKFINFQFTIVILFWFIIVIGPTVVDILRLAFYESSEPFYVLNYLPGFVPAKNERSLLLYMTLICTYYICVMGGMQLISVLSILVSSVAYMCAELRVVGTRLKLWSKDHKNPHRDLVLREIIQEHNDIIELIFLMKKYFGEFYIPQNIIVPVCITLCLFSVSQALKSGNMEMAIVVSYTLSGWLFFIFIACYFSQNLSDESVRLSKTLYEIEWENETPAVRKNLWLMMMTTKNPIVLDYKGIFPMNLQTFGEIVNLSYSYFTFLQTVA